MRSSRARSEQSVDVKLLGLPLVHLTSIVIEFDTPVPSSRWRDMGSCYGSASSSGGSGGVAVAEALFGDPINSFCSVEGRDLFVGTSSGRIALFDMRMAAAACGESGSLEQGRESSSAVCEMKDIDAWSTGGVRALQCVEGDMIAVIGDKGMKRWPASDYEPLKKNEQGGVPMLAIPFPGRLRTGGHGHSLLSGNACMVLQQGSPAYIFDAASCAYGSCSKLVLPWSSLPVHMGASSVTFRALVDASAPAADGTIDAGGWGQGQNWEFSRWGCNYSDWGSAVLQSQPR